MVYRSDCRYLPLFNPFFSVYVNFFHEKQKWQKNDFGYTVSFYFSWNSFDYSISWTKWWMLVLEMLATFWRQSGNGAVEVSFESRTAQMWAFISHTLFVFLNYSVIVLPMLPSPSSAVLLLRSLIRHKPGCRVVDSKGEWTVSGTTSQPVIWCTCGRLVIPQSRIIIHPGHLGVVMVVVVVTVSSRNVYKNKSSKSEKTVTWGDGVCGSTWLRVWKTWCCTPMRVILAVG